MWNRRVQGKDFWQSYIDNELGGVCFRLAFKWLACQIRSPGSFQFGWWQATLDEDVLRKELDFLFDRSQADTKETRPSFNVAKVTRKQKDYLDRVKPFEKPGVPYKRFRDNVNRISLEALQSWQWGTQAKHTSAKYNLTFSALEVGQSIKPVHVGGAMIIGVFGDSQDGPWAHATAFFRSDSRIAFFDANGGEFAFNTDDSNAVISAEIEAFLKNTYCTGTYTLGDFILYPAQAR